MEQLAKFITDERTGLKYELCGDYYIIAIIFLQHTIDQFRYFLCGQAYLFFI